MTERTPSTRAGRDLIVGAMPWYDEADPDYTELDAVIEGIRAEARADALREVGELRAAATDILEALGQSSDSRLIAAQRRLHAALSQPPAPGDNSCPTCGNVIIKEAHGGEHPSAGDHDPARHVEAAYAMEPSGWFNLEPKEKPDATD